MEINSCTLGFFHYFLSSVDFFKNTIRVSNSFDLDQVRHFGPLCRAQSRPMLFAKTNNRRH